MSLYSSLFPRSPEQMFVEGMKEKNSWRSVGRDLRGALPLTGLSSCLRSCGANSQTAAYHRPCGGHSTELRQNWSLKASGRHQFKFWVGEAVVAAASLWIPTSKWLAILPRDEGAHPAEVSSSGMFVSCGLWAPGLIYAFPGPSWVLGI